MQLRFGIHQVSLEASLDFLAIHVAPESGALLATELAGFGRHRFHHSAEVSLPHYFHFDVAASPSTNVFSSLEVEFLSMSPQVLGKIRTI